MRLIEAYPEMEDKKKLIYANEFAEIIKDLDITVGGKPAQWNDAKRTVLNELNLMPDADVAPVVHGYWSRELIRNENGGCVGAKMICSNCKQDNKHDEYMLYCPNCGAKMDMGRI